MKLADAFARLHGRPPTDDELARFERFRTAFDIHENDAFWWILLALDHYDGLYGRYPEQLSAQIGRILAEGDARISETIRRELSRIPPTATTFARPVPGAGAVDVSARTCAPLTLRAAPLAVGGVIAILLFGSLCMAVGYTLANRGPVSWLTHASGSPRSIQLLALLLGAPTGWIAFMLLLPVALCGIRFGWRTTHEPLADAGDRVVGWGIIATSLAGITALLTLLYKIL